MPSVGRRQAAHGELDLAIRQFAPALDHAHIAGLRVTLEEIARLGPRGLARQGERLAQKTIARFAPARHPIGKITRRAHAATPSTRYDRLNIGIAKAAAESRLSSDCCRRSWPQPWPWA